MAEPVPLRKGWLRKLPVSFSLAEVLFESLSWRRRFIVLSRDACIHWSSAEDAAARGTLMLSASTTVTLSKEGTTEERLVVSGNDGRTLVLWGDDLNGWAADIEACVASLRGAMQDYVAQADERAAAALAAASAPPSLSLTERMVRSVTASLGQGSVTGSLGQAPPTIGDTAAAPSAAPPPDTKAPPPESKSSTPPKAPAPASAPPQEADQEASPPAAEAAAPVSTAVDSLLLPVTSIGAGISSFSRRLSTGLLGGNATSAEAPAPAPEA